MAFRQWAKENTFVVAAVALPALVAAFFVLATVIPGWFVDPPRYDFIYTDKNYDQRQVGDQWASVRIKNEQLVGRVITAKQTQNHLVPKLYRYHADTGNVAEISISIPSGFDSTGEPENQYSTETLSTADFPLDLFSGRRILTNHTSPDGYVFRSNTRGGSGLFGEIFGMGRYRSHHGIEKSGNVIPIPHQGATNYYYGNVTFLGWLADD